VSLVSDHTPSFLRASKKTRPVALLPVTEKLRTARPVAPPVDIAAFAAVEKQGVAAVDQQSAAAGERGREAADHLRQERLKWHK